MWSVTWVNKWEGTHGMVDCRHLTNKSPSCFLVEEEAYAQVRNNNPLSFLPITSGQIPSGHFDKRNGVLMAKVGIYVMLSTLQCTAVQDCTWVLDLSATTNKKPFLTEALPSCIYSQYQNYVHKTCDCSEVIYVLIPCLRVWSFGLIVSLL